MKIGAKYKIARRLGAPVFEKTQSPKYTLSLARKDKADRGRGRPKSEYGLAMLEKQKTRYSYGLTESQFRIYVNKALRAGKPVEKLFVLLETRLDNALYRAGFAKTRSAARQVAGHGHTLVNGRRVTIPSIGVKIGDKLSLREGSRESALFSEVSERMRSLSMPVWIKVDPETRMAEIIGDPVYVPGEQLFDLGVAIEFYNR